METMFGFAALVVVTILGLFAALALQALLLRVAFVLMQPATADRRVLRPAIERGAQMAARACARTN
jgi:type II secretory pathway component PulJ